MFNVLIASGKTKQQRPVAGVLASVLLHGGIITAVLLGGRPAIHAATEFEQRIAEYLFPKDRAPKVSDQTLAYVGVSGGGSASAASVGANGNGTEKEPTGTRKPTELDLNKPDAAAAAAPAAIAAQVKMAESMGAFTMLDVDSAAVRDPRSAAPVYPKDMEADGLDGSVNARFVVDSTGRIDLSTVRILAETNDSFVRAVRAAMPDMRFRPAFMGAKPVRQLSEQEFKFHLQMRRDTIYRVMPPPRKPFKPE